MFHGSCSNVTAANIAGHSSTYQLNRTEETERKMRKMNVWSFECVEENRTVINIRFWPVSTDLKHHWIYSSYNMYSFLFCGIAANNVINNFLLNDILPTSGINCWWEWAGFMRRYTVCILLYNTHSYMQHPVRSAFVRVVSLSGSSWWSRWLGDGGGWKSTNQRPYTCPLTRRVLFKYRCALSRNE